LFRLTCCSLQYVLFVTLVVTDPTDRTGLTG